MRAERYEPPAMTPKPNTREQTEDEKGALTKVQAKVRKRPDLRFKEPHTEKTIVSARARVLRHAERHGLAVRQIARDLRLCATVDDVIRVAKGHGINPIVRTVGGSGD